MKPGRFSRLHEKRTSWKPGKRAKGRRLLQNPKISADEDGLEKQEVDWNVSGSLRMRFASKMKQRWERIDPTSRSLGSNTNLYLKVSISHAALKIKEILVAQVESRDDILYSQRSDENYLKHLETFHQHEAKLWLLRRSAQAHRTDSSFFDNICVDDWSRHLL